jgi:argininosuccinate lyase
MTNTHSANDSAATKANPLWGGHFDQGPARIMEQINQSISFDQKLYRQDIQGSIAHCTMLVAQNIIPKTDGDAIIAGLKQILQEIESGRFTFKVELEDIHMNVESRLHEIMGDNAGKLHTARSRNDQVATDLRLWVRDILDVLDLRLQALQAALITRAEEHAAVIMPGFTHLQTAQPVTLGHHLLAYVEMVGRDRSRIRDCRARLNECPLGSAALAGTSFPIDRAKTSELLGFDRPTANSLDAVADRDFALEFLSLSAVCAMHLSRFAEEMVIWCSAGFRFISLSNAFTSGSSIMPQKRNPDAAELVRAKTGRITGNFNSLLMVMKGLPLTYSKDMQEDKEPVFDTAENLQLCIAAMTGMVLDFTVNEEAMRKAASAGYSTATDLADWLVKNLHLPFRKCHHITGRIVKLAEAKNCTLDQLSLEEMQSVEPLITQALFTVLSVDDSVASRRSFGGTSPDNVRAAIKLAKERYL